MSEIDRLLEIATKEACLMGHPFINREQVLIAILTNPHCRASQAMRSFGVDRHKVRDEAQRIIGIGQGVMLVENPLTPRTKQLLDLAKNEADALKDTQLTGEHLLLAITTQNGGVAAQVLENLGVDRTELRKRLLDLMIDSKMQSPK